MKITKIIGITQMKEMIKLSEIIKRIFVICAWQILLLKISRYLTEKTRMIKISHKEQTDKMMKFIGLDRAGATVAITQFM